MAYTNYNITEWADSLSGTDTFTSFLGYTSQQTNYLPGLIILMIVAFIIFFTLKIKGYSTNGTLVAVTFINFILAVMMYPLQIINGQTLVISILLLPAALVVIFLTDS